MNKPTTGPERCDFGESGRRVATRSGAHGRASCFAFIATTLLTLCISGSSRADQLYGFTDERGVFHFSDAPSDPRYRQILAAGRGPVTDIRKTEPRRAAAPLSQIGRAHV